MVKAEAKQSTVRIEYTTENRRGASRHAVEVVGSKVDLTIARLVEKKDAYNFVISVEVGDRYVDSLPGDLT